MNVMAKNERPESTRQGVLKNKDIIMSASKHIDSKKSRVQCSRFEELSLIKWSSLCVLQMYL